MVSANSAAAGAFPIPIDTLPQDASGYYAMITGCNFTKCSTFQVRMFGNHMMANQEFKFKTWFLMSLSSGEDAWWTGIRRFPNHGYSWELSV